MRWEEKVPLEEQQMAEVGEGGRQKQIWREARVPWELP